MKKSTAFVSILSLSTVFVLTTLNVFAESNDFESKRQTLGSADPKPEHGDRQERGGQNNEMRNEVKDERDNQDSERDNETEEDTTEMSLHDHVSNAPDIKIAVTLPEISSTTVSTYADVVSVLTQYQNTIKTITTSGTLVDASSTLTIQEQAILSKLMRKHTDSFDYLKARANDLSLQIKDLIDVLTPLGTTTISPSFNLKNLILSQLKDFRGAINDLKDLGDTSVDIIEQETN